MTDHALRNGFAMVVLTSVLLMPTAAAAHCDSLDGPVVKAAQTALETGEVWRVLIWVHENDEAEIMAALQRARAVRRLGEEAKQLADYYFFETAVRVHRAGEGEPYTGLKPVGQPLGSALLAAAADRAIETGAVEGLMDFLTTAVKTGMLERFEAVRRAKLAVTPGDVAAGRRFVEEYTAFVQYVEGLLASATTSPRPHAPPSS